MKSEYSARRLLTNHPEQSIVPLRQAMLAAAELQHRAQDYKNSIDRPGGLPWDGVTARAIQDTAASDEKTIYLATQMLLDDAPKALVTLEFQSIEYRREAVDLYNEAVDHGYTVAEDLTATWIMQPHASAETIEKGNRYAAKFTRMMRKAYDKWWAAELEAQQQIEDICDALAASFNPFCGLTSAQETGMEPISRAPARKTKPCSIVSMRRRCSTTSSSRTWRPVRASPSRRTSCSTCTSSRSLSMASPHRNRRDQGGAARGIAGRDDARIRSGVQQPGQVRCALHRRRPEELHPGSGL